MQSDPNPETNRQKRFCMKCFKSYQIDILESSLFKDSEFCKPCTAQLELEAKKKAQQEQKTCENLMKQTESYGSVISTKLHLFLTSHYASNPEFSVLGYKGSIHMKDLQKLTSHCREIKVTNFRTLFYHHIEKPKFYYPPYKICFDNIKHFELKGEKIYNIEFLQVLPLENIKDLSLWDNFIVELKSLKKCKLQRLQEIHLSHNKLNSVSGLNRAGLKNIQKISLGFKQGPSFQSCKDLLKNDCQRISQIYLNYLPFIIFYDKSLQKRFSHLYKIASFNNCVGSTGRNL